MICILSPPIDSQPRAFAVLAIIAKSRQRQTVHLNASHMPQLRVHCFHNPGGRQHVNHVFDEAKSINKELKFN